VDNELVIIDYTNYRGERDSRIIRPVRIWFGETEWHPGTQWLMDAVDVSKSANRTFALKDVHSWTLPQDASESN